MPALRIAIVCEFPTLNGGERSLLAALAALGDTIAPVVLGPREGALADTLRERGVTHVPFDVHPADGRREDANRLLEQIQGTVRSLRPSVLHGNSLAMGRLTGRLAERVEAACTAHLRDILRPSRRVVSDLNRNRRLFAVSHAVRDHYAREGIAEERMRVLHNGVDLREFHPATSNDERSRLRGELGLPDDAGLLLTIGQVGLRKGLDVLAAAASQIVRREPRAHFLVVGERNSRKGESVEFERRFDKAFLASPLAGRLHRLGRRDDVARLLRGADLLIHPARQEPLGRVLLEAAASGLPIVATDVGGTREILTDGASALLVGPDDAAGLAEAVLRLLGDKSMCKSFAATARRDVESRFDVQTTSLRLLEAWSAVVDGGKA